MLPTSFRQKCRDAMLACPSHPSFLQRSVGTALAEIFSGFEEEVVEPLTGYSLDLALQSREVAVEVEETTTEVRTWLHLLLDKVGCCTVVENVSLFVQSPLKFSRRLLLFIYGQPRDT